MSKLQYQYNPKTLRYERVQFSIWRFLGSLVSYFAFGYFFFFILNALQNKFIETEHEKLLRSENNEISSYMASLTNQYLDSKNKLKNLQQKEAGLYQQFFQATPEPADEAVSTPSMPEGIKAQLDYLKQRTLQVKNKSQASNYILSQSLYVDKSDVPNLFKMPIGLPVANIAPDNLISGFGIRINPFHKAKYHHDGVDFSFAKGTPVTATGPGKVLNFAYSTVEGALGNYIEIDHGNGIISRYAHLQDIYVVTRGQKIEKGQKIGTVGSSGSSAAPHLHYEIIKDEKSVDPMIYMVEGISAEAYNQLVNKSKKLNQSLD